MNIVALLLVAQVVSAAPLDIKQLLGIGADTVINGTASFGNDWSSAYTSETETVEPSTTLLGSTSTDPLELFTNLLGSTSSDPVVSSTTLLGSASAELFGFVSTSLVSSSNIESSTASPSVVVPTSSVLGEQDHETSSLLAQETDATESDAYSMTSVQTSTTSTASTAETSSEVNESTPFVVVSPSSTSLEEVVETSSSFSSSAATSGLAVNPENVSLPSSTVVTQKSSSSVNTVLTSQTMAASIEVPKSTISSIVQPSLSSFSAEATSSPTKAVSNTDTRLSSFIAQLSTTSTSVDQQPVESSSTYVESSSIIPTPVASSSVNEPATPTSEIKTPVDSDSFYKTPVESSTEFPAPVESSAPASSSESPAPVESSAPISSSESPAPVESSAPISSSESPAPLESSAPTSSSKLPVSVEPTTPTSVPSTSYEGEAQTVESSSSIETPVYSSSQEQTITVSHEVSSDTPTTTLEASSGSSSLPALESSTLTSSISSTSSDNVVPVKSTPTESVTQSPEETSLVPVHPSVISVEQSPSVTETVLVPSTSIPEGVGTISEQAPLTTSTTSNWLPTSIVVPTRASETTTTTQAVRASSLPQAITPSVAEEVPHDYQLITIGFKSPWDYPFIVNNSIVSAQIFEFLPPTLEFTLEYNASNISVVQLVPFTSSNVDYIITVAEVYFPIDAVAQLQEKLLDLNSEIYNNPDGTLDQLSELIDPSIPITGLLEKLKASTSADSSDSNDGISPNFGSMDYSQTDINGQTSSSDSTGRTVGIAVGSVVGATMYISLMVLSARYYIVRRSIKLDSATVSMRSSSRESLNEEVVYGAGVTTNSTSNDSHTMSQLDNYIPHISKPVATQNSLGWS